MPAWVSTDGTPGEGTPWAQLWSGAHLVVFRHDAVRGLHTRPHAFSFDTGCVYGGWFTGVWLPERDLVSAPTRATYTQCVSDAADVE